MHKKREPTTVFWTTGRKTPSVLQEGSPPEKSHSKSASLGDSKRTIDFDVGFRLKDCSHTRATAAHGSINKLTL